MRVFGISHFGLPRERNQALRLMCPIDMLAGSGSTPTIGYPGASVRYPIDTPNE